MDTPDGVEIGLATIDFRTTPGALTSKVRSLIADVLRQASRLGPGSVSVCMSIVSLSSCFVVPPRFTAPVQSCFSLELPSFFQ